MKVKEKVRTIKFDKNADWFQNVAEKIQDKKQQNNEIIPIKIKKWKIKKKNKKNKKKK